MIFLRISLLLLLGLTSTTLAQAAPKMVAHHSDEPACPFYLNGQLLRDLPIERSQLPIERTSYKDLTQILLDEYATDYLERRKLLRVGPPGSPICVVPGQKNAWDDGKEVFLHEKTKNDLTSLIAGIPKGLSPEKFKEAYENVIQQRIRARDKDPKKEIAYNVDFENPFDLACDGKMQCYGGTVLQQLLLRLYLTESEYNANRPLVIFKENHILSGYIKKNEQGVNELLGVEQTGSGASLINHGNVEELKGKIRVLDAEDFLRTEAVKSAMFEGYESFTFDCLLKKTAVRLKTKHFYENEALIAADASAGSVTFGGKKSRELNKTKLGFGGSKDGQGQSEKGDQKRQFVDKDGKGAKDGSTPRGDGPVIQPTLDPSKTKGGRPSEEAYVVKVIGAEDLKEQDQAQEEMKNPVKREPGQLSEFLQMPSGYRYRLKGDHEIQFESDLPQIVAEQKGSILALLEQKKTQEAEKKFKALFADFYCPIDLGSLSSADRLEFMNRILNANHIFDILASDRQNDHKVAIKKTGKDFTFDGMMHLSDYEFADLTATSNFTGGMERSLAHQIAKTHKMPPTYSTSRTFSAVEIKDQELLEAYAALMHKDLSDADRLTRTKVLLNSMDIEWAFQDPSGKTTAKQAQKIQDDYILSIGKNFEVLAGTINSYSHRNFAADFSPKPSKIILVPGSSLAKINAALNQDEIKQFIEKGQSYTSRTGAILVNTEKPQKTYSADFLLPRWRSEANSSNYGKLNEALLRRQFPGVSFIFPPEENEDVLPLYTGRMNYSFPSLVMSNPDLAKQLKDSAQAGTWIIERADSNDLSAVRVDKFSHRIFLPMNYSGGKGAKDKIAQELIKKLKTN
ncbi:MAG: hypothetical protein H7222_06220 [Methylotenera sp.]|nr:hypothetical protein [Oligoflexia bacterium]